MRKDVEKKDNPIAPHVRIVDANCRLSNLNNQTFGGTYDMTQYLPMMCHTVAIFY